VDVSARGSRLEAFVNLAVEAGATLLDLRRDGAELRLAVPLADFRRLRGAARATHTRLHVLSRRGLPFLIRRLRRRRALLAVAAAAVAALHVLSGYVWIVDVRGTRSIPAWQVLAAVERLGLRPGVPKGSLDVRRVADELPLVLPGIDWAGVTVQGTRATVEVAEHARGPGGFEQATYPADVVASRDGVVAGVLVLAGRALVQPGDTVRRGQVLIAGRLPAPDGGEALVHARGTVTARVWYDRYVEVSLHQTRVEPTGRAVVRRAVRLFGREIDLGGWRPVPFPDYRLERTTLTARWRSVTLPVALETLRYTEVTRLRRRLTEAEAKAEAERRAMADLRRVIPPGAKVLSEDAQVVQVTAGRLGLSLRVEVEEGIGIARPIPGVPPDGAGNGSQASRS
jgi:similar to stage IV sporulation protein